MTVLCLVDVGCRCAEDRDIMFMQSECQVVWYLAAHRDNYPVRRFKVYDVHDPLEGQFIKIEPVAFVIVRRDGLRVIIDQHSPVALFLYGLETGH